MPLYEYQCKKCGETFEMLRSIRNADSDLECPHCHSDKIERMISTFATGGCGTSKSRGFT
jgi:putative FmdB family regulatory protein